MTPLAWLGAPAPGGLALPDAKPTPGQMYGPRGVWLDDRCLIVADSGNHRVMIWHTVPDRDHQPADVVLGQPDFTTEGPKAGGRGPENGFSLPTGVAVIEGRLVVADSWHHRLLVWDRVPDRTDAPPDAVVGQNGFAAIETNRGGAISATGFYWPYGLGAAHGWFWVTDTGNRRVLGWHGFPTDGRPADVILGQDAPNTGGENRGGPVSARSFRWPHAVAATDDLLLVADAGNHRVLGWRFPVTDRAADVVLGQPAFDTNREWPHGKQGPAAFRFPYSLATRAGELIVADTANNRLLLWRSVPAHGAGHPADAVIGQPGFDTNGENHWTAVTAGSLCWPYGVCRHGNRLAVADSGNNRVMIWDVGS
ncbi:hypothetical protein FTUN_2485 [Frigoriglobus tundricola]|uniref:Uncharacterized protein n=2 Tax=Frigoriglobus tundricola TaxID=2774151 RepID=A0A6M5YLJ0_9BACT|nr:hypothetical protein FTUN_2485 [Frigoriglobus tundricola]